MFIFSHNSLIWVHKIKRQLLQHVWILRSLVLLSLITLIIGLGSLFFKPVAALANRLLSGPKVVSTFFTDPLYTLPSYGGRTNILFIGMGGGTHDGALLTDTMIFASLDLKHSEVTMLSLPRDIWVSSIKAKLNAAYEFGETKEPGGGYPLVEDAVYEIVGQPIHYIVSLDFSSFEKLIDVLGGVDVQIDRGFTDEWYPVEGKENEPCPGDPQYKCRYETIQFKQGLVHMDGNTALKFARSRHAEGDQGTDFARSLRQQKIIQAIKNKLTSSQTLLNPVKLLELKSVAFQYIKINKPISDNEYAAFAGFGMNFWRTKKEVKTISLDTGDDDNPGFLINPPTAKYDGQWVLVPRTGVWDDFQAFFRQKLVGEG